MKDEIIFTPFYSSFLRLCQETGKTPSKVAEEAGISSGAPTAWKKGAVPKPPQRKKLCEYFDVTDNVLLGYERPGDLGGEKQKEKPASETGSGPVDYERLTDENKTKAQEFIWFLLNSQS